MPMRIIGAGCKESQANTLPGREALLECPPIEQFDSKTLSEPDDPLDAEYRKTVKSDDPGGTGKSSSRVEVR